MFYPHDRNGLSHYDAYIRKAHHERAKAVAQITAQVGHALARAARLPVRGVKALVRMLVNACRYRATIRALHALDDNTLKDIGLPRGEIEARARSCILSRGSFRPPAARRDKARRMKASDSKSDGGCASLAGLPSCPQVAQPCYPV